MSHVPEIVRRINGERITVLGWGRAILMQVAHPLIAAGVGGHSGFRSSLLGPVRRLQSTVRAMLALSFGEAAEADRAARGILAVHDRVHGQLSASVGRFPAGTAYSAHDPELLLWVHATLMDSVLLFHEQFVGPLSHAERDAYLAAAADGMTRIGLPAACAPKDEPTLRHYLRTAIEQGTLAVSPASRALADAVLAPAMGWVAFPLVRVQRLLTIGTLPPAIREMYGYRWSPGQQRRLEAVVAAMRRLRQSAPDVLARWAAARG